MIGAAGVIALLLVLAGLSATGALKPTTQTASYQPSLAGWRHGYNVHNTNITSLPAGELSDTEKEALLYMVEEEKLARDVYQALYEKWGLPIFENIARSEQQHMDSVRALLEKYGLQDPTSNTTMGEFTDSELANLYEELVAQGSVRLEEAIKVGLTIEEKDIYDLEEWMSQVDNIDIKTVFCNLEKGSRNHLRAFYKQLELYRGDYTPKYITETLFTTIITGGVEKGRAC